MDNRSNVRLDENEEMINSERTTQPVNLPQSAHVWYKRGDNVIQLTPLVL